MPGDISPDDPPINVTRHADLAGQASDQQQATPVLSTQVVDDARFGRAAAVRHSHPHGERIAGQLDGERAVLAAGGVLRLTLWPRPGLARLG